MRVALLFVLLAVPALAQQEPKPTPAKKVPVQVIDIAEGLDVEGTLLHPTDCILFSPTKAKFSTLIKIRMNFNDKLADSVHQM